MNVREMIVGILALLMFLYSFVVFRIHSGSGTFLLFFALGIFFAAYALGLHFGVWDRSPVWLRRTLLAVVFLGAAVFFFVEGLILSGFSSGGEDGLDYIIVLGAQVYEDGPSDVLKRRLDAAYDYLTENEDTICIVSGGQGSNEPFSEAQGMRDYLVEKGISEERILMEDESLNTLENLSNSSAYFDKDTASVGIVTSNFHVFRSVHLAKKLGIRYVCGIAASVNPVYLPGNMLREFLGVVKDFLCGNLI